MASGQGGSGGLRYLGVWVLDSNGFPLVSAASDDPTVPTRMRGAKAFTPNFPDGVIIQITGDDIAQGQIQLSATELSSIELRTGIGNLDVDAVLQGINVVSLAGGKIIGRETDQDGCLADVFLMGYQQSIDKDPTSATFGMKMWHFYLVPKAQVRPYSGAMEEGNAGENRYVATPQKVMQYPWGIAFASGTEGFTEATVLEGFLPGAPLLAGWLGDGTEESHRRMQAAIDELWRYAGEMFLPDAAEAALSEAGIAAEVRALEAPWNAAVDAVLAEATLARPPAGHVQKGGKQGRHTEHLGHLLAEMQFLQRAYPDARW